MTPRTCFPRPRRTAFAVATFAVFVVAALATSPGFADEEPDYARDGIYIGAGAIGAGYLNVEDDIDDSAGNRGDVELSNGVDVVLGYRFARFFAIEAEGEYVDPSDLEVTPGPRLEFSSWSVTGNARFYALTGRFQPYAKVGVGIGGAELELVVGDREDRSFVARFGAGLDTYVTENIVLTANVDYLLTDYDMGNALPSDADDLDYLTGGMGLMFRF